MLGPIGNHKMLWHGYFFMLYNKHEMLWNEYLVEINRAHIKGEEGNVIF